jgi:hypothetical protein
VLKPLLQAGDLSGGEIDLPGLSLGELPPGQEASGEIIKDRLWRNAER